MMPALPPCSVRRVTRAPAFAGLAALMTISGVLALVRIAQRLKWLLFDFQPLGTWQEALFLLLQEGGILLGNLVVMFSAGGAVRLFASQQPGGGRLLYRVERIRASLSLLGLLLVTAVTVLLVWAAAHYRTPVTVIGIVSAVGIAVVFVLGVSCRFHTNVARMLADVNASFRQGSFHMGGGVDCFLKWQCIVLMIALAVPTVLVLVEGAGVMWLIGLIEPLVGRSLVEELQRAFTGGFTSVSTMYGMECLQYLLQIAQLALVWVLYGTYRRAHDGGSSRSKAL